jgi:hypothetical protein
VVISFTDEKGKVINRYYTYKLRWKPENITAKNLEVLVTEEDEDMRDEERCNNCEKIYIKTSRTHSSLCN